MAFYFASACLTLAKVQIKSDIPAKHFLTTAAWGDLDAEPCGVLGESANFAGVAADVPRNKILRA